MFGEVSVGPVLAGRDNILDIFILINMQMQAITHLKKIKRCIFLKKKITLFVVGTN